MCGGRGRGGGWKANYEKDLRIKVQYVCYTSTEKPTEKPLKVLWKVYLGPQAEYGVLRNLKKLQLAKL